MQEKILILKTSPIKSGKSVSEQASILFADAYKKNHKNVIIDYIDLNKEISLAKVMTSENLNTFFTDGTSDKWIEKLKKYDKFIISTSMINGAPAPLFNSLMNRITISKKTFNMVLDPKTGNFVSKGIFENNQLQVIFTQGGKSSPEIRDEIISQVKIPCKFLGFQSKCLLIDGTDIQDKKGKSPNEKLIPYEKEIQKAAALF